MILEPDCDILAILRKHWWFGDCQRPHSFPVLIVLEPLGLFLFLLERANLDLVCLKRLFDISVVGRELYTCPFLPLNLLKNSLQSLCVLMENLWRGVKIWIVDEEKV